uniref:Uncharacterized protein n=1 Tax=Tanacetum cinerariifolium TaxID=118510 RepID=A0A6L2JUL2_TANCI|nr:hypothetical protein [Tanacetum cinerariifolium]
MTVTMSMKELEFLFGPMFDEYLNGGNQVVSKSFVVINADASDKRQQDTTSSTSTTVVADITQLDIQTTLEPITQASTVNADENINQERNPDKVYHLKKALYGLKQAPRADENGVETKVPSKTDQAILARQRERKAKSTLRMAIPDQYQLRFQKLISLLEVHGATVSNQDANQKFVRVIPSSWNNIALIMRNKEGIDELNIDDLYNNLKVFEADIKGSSRSSSNSQNAAFLSAKDTNSINEVNTANGVSIAAGHSSSRQAFSSSYTDDLIDHDDLEEMDLKWQVAMLSMRVSDSLDQTLKEKEDLKAKLEQFEISSKNLNKLINSQLSAKDKTGLGYGDQLSESDSEVLPSIFDGRSSDGDDNPTNDRFKKGDGYHVVPIPLTGNYMSPLADLSFARFDDYVYRPITNKASSSISKGEPSVIKTSIISVEMPNVDSVRTSGVIIEDWVSNDEDTLVDTQVDSQTTIKPNFKKIKFTKARNGSIKSDKQADKPKMVTQILRQIEKIEMTVIFMKRECQNSVLNDMGKGIGQREVRPIWNNTQRINHQNKFVPTVVLTRISKETVKTVRINGVNIVGQTSVSTVKGNGVTAVKTSAGCLWRPKINDLNNVFKDSSGSWISKGVKLIDPQGRLKHMTGNKALLTDYQDIDEGFVAFSGSTKGGQGPNWLFDIDCLANSMNYQPVTAGNQANKNVGHQEVNGDTDDKAGDNTADDVASKEKVQEPISEYDQALKNVLERMMNQEKEATEQSDNRLWIQLHADKDSC